MTLGYSQVEDSRPLKYGVKQTIKSPTHWVGGLRIYRISTLYHIIVLNLQPLEVSSVVFSFKTYEKRRFQNEKIFDCIGNYTGHICTQQRRHQMCKFTDRGRTLYTIKQQWCRLVRQLRRTGNTRRGHMQQQCWQRRRNTAKFDNKHLKQLLLVQTDIPGIVRLGHCQRQFNIRLFHDLRKTMHTGPVIGTICKFTV